MLNNQNAPVIVRQQNGRQLVSARELHCYLEVKRDFTTWCKQMFTYGFEENVDYELIHVTQDGDVYSQAVSMSVQQRSVKGISSDYIITLDCAKEICMIQRTDKGKQARLYFIECEKQLRAKQAKEEHEKQTKIIAKLEKTIQRLTIEQARLNEIVKAKVSNPPPPSPAHILKAKVLSCIKAKSREKYAQPFDSIFSEFVWDMRSRYGVDVNKETRYMGEDQIDVMIRLGYSRQIEELADFKYYFQN